MSSSEADNIDDELLALAGATEKKRKRSQQNNPSKRRKADMGDGSASEGGDQESEEGANSHPYPLEGKFLNEADRADLMSKPEIEREAILAARQEEMQRFKDKHQLESMLKLRNGRGGDETVSRAAKRQHAVRGATKEKSRKLDELKAKRKAKDEKKRTRGDSPKRDRSSSPMDMETDDGEEEDGQFTKDDEEEERDRKLFSKLAPEEEPTTTIEDLSSCRLTRIDVSKHCMKPWFEEYVKGAWVRYLIGNENGQPVYRLCEVSEISANTVKPYKVDEQLVNQELELKHGESTKRFPMDKISNGRFEPKEFERLVKACENDKVKLPSKRQLEKKAAQMQRLATQPMTESDIAAMLARKQAINAAKQSTTSLAMERSRLQQERTLAMRRQDYSEVKRIDEKLAELSASIPSRDSRHEESASDNLAKINERNRKLNQEQVRRAERMEMERKRRERQLRAGTATPTGGALDAAARLKAKMLASGNSRAGTPGTPTAGGTTPRSASPAATPSKDGEGQTKGNGARNFEASVLESVEIDLGDF
ncbi:plus-3-domain-containing protein [Lentinus tigrinus ALCF2SS1-7]|uniref:Plus-3-domain-containing protein n=1 Tax=Lentinus tigrinus ALCF2SS1-6 TaxID=1328759 RepID=A0A5C2SJX0_9APHY|nr:plus-3-domain-containing protein [Lentinus tigrinus ALCF2SS1-6]RPD76013.1 plus-3-domain-containing protein [Lentinus tigrinus ALCF2SS1-7]